MSLVFPPLNIACIIMFQVLQTFQDACRFEGEYSLSSPLIWSGNPPLISCLKSPKLSRYIRGFYWKDLNRIWEYFNGWMGVSTASVQLYSNYSNILTITFQHAYLTIVYILY